jgi:hypothetical protein
MNMAEAKWLERPTKMDPSRKGKAQVLKFDRRAGVIVAERVEPPSKPKPVIGLVRNLLALFSPVGPAERQQRRTQYTKSR